MTELRRILPLLLLPLVLILAGCGLLATATTTPPATGTPPATATPAPTTTAAPTQGPSLTPIPGAEGDIGSQRETWQARGITSYTWQIQYRCFCPDNGPTTIVIKDGTVTSVTNAAGPVAAGRLPEFALTLDALYAQLADTLARGGTVKATFGGGGVPAVLSVDPIRNAMDDEYGIEVLSFSPA